MSDPTMYEPFMRAAVALAERGRWLTCPNPTVGAVLVRDGQQLAEGWHHACGEAHAEVDCLRDAAEKGVDPRECTLVVTLEPCNHQGRTPPCTDRILEAGIRRVVIGLRDPNPVAAGGVDTALLPVYAVGVVTAAVSGYLSIALVRLVANKGKFGAFAYYCWAAGLVTLALTALQ